MAARRSRSQYLEVYVTFANAAEAERIVCTVMRERLAACVNLWPIRSRYRWRGKLVRRRETTALFKTTHTQYQKLESRIRALHSYAVPCIIAWPIVRGFSGYLRWISENTHGNPPTNSS